MNRNRHNVGTYRSGLEKKNSDLLRKSRVVFTYEVFKIKYTKPVTNHTYTPDFVLSKSAIIIETKGIFDSKDRKKHLLVRAQHPELDIRFVFSNSRSKLYKGSKTTYAMWCEKNKFMYADKLIPEEWMNEQ